MSAGSLRLAGAAGIVLAVLGLIVVAVSQAAPQPLVLPATAAPAVTSVAAPAAPVAPVAPVAGGPITAARVSPDWVAPVAARTGVPARALAGYAAAALRTAAEQPSCGLSWPTLAALGAVESVHGTHGGTFVGSDGRTGEEIIGVALDGGPGVAAISDSDAGRLDGDTTWDRAVGPLQFIPSTWRRWAADGNDDGAADPHNLDDAALSAARYLCASGGDLGDPAAWRAAVLSYNRSGEYAARVLDTANAYARASWG